MNKNFFRFHLISGIVAMMSASVCLYLNVRMKNLEIYEEYFYAKSIYAKKYVQVDHEEVNHLEYGFPFIILREQRPSSLRAYVAVWYYKELALNIIINLLISSTCAFICEYIVLKSIARAQLHSRRVDTSGP